MPRLAPPKWIENGEWPSGANRVRIMRRQLRQIGGITLLLGGLLGCNRSAVQHKEPHDPMLITKPAVQGQAHASHLLPIPRVEPAPPLPLPADVDAPPALRGETLSPPHPEP